MLMNDEEERGRNVMAKRRETKK